MFWYCEDAYVKDPVEVDLIWWTFGICRYNDLRRLRWSNVPFEPNGSSIEVIFEIRKNARLRQGNMVIMAAGKQRILFCLIRLIKNL